MLLMVVEDQTFAGISITYSHAHTPKHQRLVLQYNLVQCVQHYSLNIKKRSIWNVIGLYNQLQMAYIL